MGVERLQLLIRCCNVSGLLPFRMVLNNRTKQFERFDNHWRHPANWWFALLLIAHIFLTVVHIYISLIDLTDEKSEPITTFQVVLILFNGHFIVLFSIPRLFLLQVRHLETAFDILHRIDRRMPGNISPTSSADTVLRRSYIGIAITLIGVIGKHLLSKVSFIFKLFNLIAAFNQHCDDSSL